MLDPKQVDSILRAAYQFHQTGQNPELVEMVRKAVYRLEPREYMLIAARYLTEDPSFITDRWVMGYMEISPGAYYGIKYKALWNLSDWLGDIKYEPPQRNHLPKRPVGRPRKPKESTVQKPRVHRTRNRVKCASIRSPDDSTVESRVEFILQVASLSLCIDRNQQFVRQVQEAVDGLEPLERDLIVSRYLAGDASYIRDHHVFGQLGICGSTYNVIRRSAFRKLAECFANCELLDHPELHSKTTNKTKAR